MFRVTTQKQDSVQRRTMNLANKQQTMVPRGGGGSNGNSLNHSVTAKSSGPVSAGLGSVSATQSKLRNQRAPLPNAQ